MVALTEAAGEGAGRLWRPCWRRASVKKAYSKARSPLVTDMLENGANRVPVSFDTLDERSVQRCRLSLFVVLAQLFQDTKEALISGDALVQRQDQKMNADRVFKSLK